MGGLGFHDLEKFNQALLVKQAWRIWKSPNSLVARILKARYFPRSSLLDGTIDRRPSYAWRSIMFGRNLLKQGLIKEIGNGRDSQVWLDKWILDTVPRPPTYRQDNVVDLTLNVEDLLDRQFGGWNVRKIRQVIAEEDVARVLATRTFSNITDSLKWGFSPNGVYNTKSGYSLIQKIQDSQTPASMVLPPLEKQLWSSIWKSKTSPKLRHFLWKVMAGALAVKQQLRSRGIPIDPMCSCGLGPENICHMLFHCPKVREMWSLSQFPLPPAGFSNTSVFLNLHYLISSSGKRNLDPKLRLTFPWILWHIWKARNLLCFEQTSLSAEDFLSKALDEASVWLTLNVSQTAENSRPNREVFLQGKCTKPPMGFIKCNVGFSWSPYHQRAGAFWLVRDSSGKALYHARRAFFGITSSHHASMSAFAWASEAMADLKLDRVLMEVSTGMIRQVLNHPESFMHLSDLVERSNVAALRFSSCRLQMVPTTCNTLVMEIAESVTRDQRWESYVATHGPAWLEPRIRQEASTTTFA